MYCIARLWDNKGMGKDINTKCTNLAHCSQFCKKHYKQYCQSGCCRGGMLDENNKQFGLFFGTVEEETPYRFNDILVISWNNDSMRTKIKKDIEDGVILRYQTLHLRNKGKVKSIFNNNGTLKSCIANYLKILDKSFMSNKNKKTIDMNIESFVDVQLIEDDDIDEITFVRIKNKKVYISYDEGDTYEDDFGIFYYSTEHGSDVIENKVNGGVRHFKEIYQFNPNKNMYELAHKEKL